MGLHIHTNLPALDLKGVSQENKGPPQSSSGFLWQRQQKKLRRRMRNRTLKGIKRPKILMKRRVPLEGSRRPQNEVLRKVRTLQRLVPNGASMNLEGLFMETADHIQCLQMQLKVLQIVIQVFSSSNCLGKGGSELSM